VVFVEGIITPMRLRGLMVVTGERLLQDLVRPQAQWRGLRIRGSEGSHLKRGLPLGHA